MDPLTGLATAAGIQGVSNLIRSATESSSEASSGGFDGYLRSILKPDSANQVNEEELFAALLQERISDLKGEDAGEQFAELFQKHSNSMARSDGYVPVESAAKAALKDMVSDGEVSADEADRIHSEAFAAAQLDSNTSALYDGRGGSNDPTVATAEIESALAAAQLMIEKFESGDESPTVVPLSSSATGSTTTVSSTNSPRTAIPETPSGNTVDGPDGFVFKPESDHERKLVILLPARMAYDVEKVILRDENGNEVEEGTSSGYANGGREHWRFDRAGGAYPDNITVEVTMRDGSTQTITIPNPGERYD